MIKYTNLPYVVSKFEPHNQIKQQLLEIMSTDVGESIQLDGLDKITKTDWYVDGKIQRNYLQFVFPHLHTHMIELMRELGQGNFSYSEFWYQQYYTTDKHRWHQHLGCSWASVYYVELSKDAPRTLIKNPFNKQEIIIPELEEGDILSFPGFLWHCSPENTSNERKTIIAFNVI